MCAFYLYLRVKKGYNFGVPICPRCNTPIHTGAESQCPACGYSLLRANAVFGDHGVSFSRVLDRAGALTHSERQDLTRALADMERNLPPIALCIYITNDGRAQYLRSHAHWMLNHAQIYHPSFGRREKVQAIEDAELTELAPGEKAGDGAPARPVSWWQRLRTGVRDVLHPYPPPVRPEWMLILVLDVQLELACFTWGYMLDPYVNPDSINSCIIGARLQFRERDMLSGLKRVMKAAVSRIAAQSHAVNRRLKRGGMPLLLGLGLAGALLAGNAHAQGQLPVFADEEVAVAEDDAQPSPAPVPPAAAPSSAPAAAGRAAASAAAPRWTEEDYRHLLSGELNAGYKMLQVQGSATPPAEKQPVRNGRSRSQESDTKVPKHYYPGYSVADATGLIDPQRLLSGVERADVEYTLRELNARSPYHLYIGVYRQGQDLPMELAVGALVRSVARPGEYAAMLLYGMGDTPELDLGYHEMKLSDEDRHAWLERVLRAARHRGGVEGLMAAAAELHSCLEPVAAELPPLLQQSAVHVPLIPLEMRPDVEVKEPSFRDNMREMLKHPVVHTIAMVVGGVLGAAGLLLLFVWLRRRSGKLLQTRPDYRLASPCGAGVSRAVSYLEGKLSNRVK